MWSFRIRFSLLLLAGGLAMMSFPSPAPSPGSSRLYPSITWCWRLPVHGRRMRRWTHIYIVHSNTLYIHSNTPFIYSLEHILYIHSNTLLILLKIQVPPQGIDPIQPSFEPQSSDIHWLPLLPMELEDTAEPAELFKKEDAAQNIKHGNRTRHTQHTYTIY